LVRNKVQKVEPSDAPATVHELVLGLIAEDIRVAKALMSYNKQSTE